MPFLLAEILNFQGSTHHIGVGSFRVLFFLVSIKIIILMIFYWYFVINMMTFNFVIRDYTIFKLMFKLPSQLFYIVI